MAATPDDIRTWGKQAQEIADLERRRVAKERGKAFEKWTHEAWSTKPGQIFNLCKKELPAPIMPPRTSKGNGSFRQIRLSGKQPKDGLNFGRARTPGMS
eukprot:4481134-Heterocapsa_arctica.AAC.1